MCGAATTWLASSGWRASGTASIQGPVLGSDYSPSVDIVALMLRGKMPLVPRDPAFRTRRSGAPDTAPHAP
jgi:hypothetical protein